MKKIYYDLIIRMLSSCDSAEHFDACYHFADFAHVALQRTRELTEPEAVNWLNALKVEIQFEQEIFNDLNKA
jgi:hypothetical protein